MMGCDIHAHVEVKIRGKWEHYNHPQINRNYALFYRMAGVRGGHLEPISEPRGLPEDVSVTTRFDSDHWGEDGHTHSWLSAQEAGMVQHEFANKQPGSPPTFGYLFGNYIESHLSSPNDAKRLIDAGFEDARVVFWFDN